MPIRVDPAVLRQASESVGHVGSGAGRVGTDLAGAASGLPSYDGQLGPLAHAAAAEAFARTRAVADRLAYLGSWLQERATAFEAADMASQAGLRALSVPGGSWERWRFLSMLAGWLKAPLYLVPFYLWLGGLLRPGKFNSALAVEYILGRYDGRAWRGRTFKGLRAPAFVSDPAGRLVNWLKGKGWRTDYEVADDELGPDDAARHQYLAGARDREARRQMEWWEQNGQDQYSPKVRDVGRSVGAEFNGCGPTVLAMMVNFKNYQAGAGRTDYGADEFFRTAIGQKAFTRADTGTRADTLMDGNEMARLANPYGYRLESATAPQFGYEQLKTKVNSGEPIMVLVSADSKGNLKQLGDGATVAHYVIVVQVKPDGSAVVMNPIGGQLKPVPQPLFEKAWRETGKSKLDGSIQWSNRGTNVAYSLKLK